MWIYLADFGFVAAGIKQSISRLKNYGFEKTAFLSAHLSAALYFDCIFECSM